MMMISSGNNEKKRFRDLLSRKEFIIVGAVFIILTALLYYIFFTPNYYHRNEPVVFEISRGESLSTVIDNLYEQGLIPSKFNMKVASFIYGAERKLRAGRYYIPNGLSYVGLSELFVYGDADFLREVKVYDGSSLGWIASKLRIDAAADSAAFVETAKNREFLKSRGIKTSSFDGYLLPDKYYFYERSSPEEILDTFINRFNSFFTDSMKKAAADNDLDSHKVVILASIVEGETNDESEMPTIAGVYLNRMKKGMKLQADPTVQFLLKEGWRRLLYIDLRIDSPYNTYKYYGLPPGPINNPGKEAIMSVVYPTEHDYYYFVADGNGGHNFAETLAGHNRNVQEYRKKLKESKAN